jgi:DHA2 family multidrug resistance protein
MPNIDEHRVDFRTWVGVSGTMLGAFMAVLDIQITNASLRDITGGIAATQDEGSWVSTRILEKQNWLQMSQVLFRCPRRR